MNCGHCGVWVGTIRFGQPNLTGGAATLTAICPGCGQAFVGYCVYKTPEMAHKLIGECVSLLVEKIRTAKELVMIPSEETNNE